MPHHAPHLSPGGFAGLPGAHPAANVPRVLRTEGVPGVRAGNSFELLGTGERAYQALHEEIARALNVSEKTVKRYWAYAKAWLQRALVERPNDPRLLALLGTGDGFVSPQRAIASEL
jgi:hypothetical protein